MAHSYPIWVEINSCNYKQPKSYGVRKHSTQKINIGTSATNSHHFANVKLTHSIDGFGQHHYRLYVDDILVKHAIMYAKDGKGKPDTIKQMGGILRQPVLEEAEGTEDESAEYLQP